MAKAVASSPHTADTGKALKKFAFKTLENLASTKTYIIIASTVFFYIGKLSEGTWQETMLIVAGLRAATDVASMFKKEPKGEAAAESEKD